MAQPAIAVRQAMLKMMAENGWDLKLGRDLFPPPNWHQSLSDKYAASDDVCRSMMKAGAQVDAAAFTLMLNRVRGAALNSKIHWEFRATRRPPEFDALLAAIRDALVLERLGWGHGNTPHVTICYRAPCSLPLTQVNPILWRIDELLLVKTQPGTPRYHPIARWPLRPAPSGLKRQGELW